MGFGCEAISTHSVLIALGDARGSEAGAEFVVDPRHLDVTHALAHVLAIAASGSAPHVSSKLWLNCD